MKEYLLTYDDGSTLHVVAKNEVEAKERAIKANKNKDEVFSVEDYYL